MLGQSRHQRSATSTVGGLGESLIPSATSGRLASPQDRGRRTDGATAGLLGPCLGLPAWDYWCAVRAARAWAAARFLAAAAASEKTRHHDRRADRTAADGAGTADAGRFPRLLPGHTGAQMRWIDQ